MLRRPTWPFVLGAAASMILAGVVLASPAQDYVLYCMGCHGTQAEGVPGKVPPLAHSLACFMRTPAGRDYLMRVPGAANSALSDARLAAVLNWLAAQYSADESSSDIRLFTTQEVSSARHNPLAAVQARRREVVGELAATGPAPPVAGYGQAPTP